MKYIVSAFLLLLSGCSGEKTVEHTLSCLLESVIEHKTDKVMTFKKEDVIKNGFVYNFYIYADKIAVENSNDTTYGKDIYFKDQQLERSYSLQREDGIDTNMKFVFSKNYDDVEFHILDKKITYTYSCGENSR